MLAIKSCCFSRPPKTIRYEMRELSSFRAKRRRSLYFPLFHTVVEHCTMSSGLVQHMTHILFIWFFIGCRSDTNKELSKRRHASGSRQLSVISDGFDPLDMLTIMGFDRSIDGQDISFSELLNNSNKRIKTSSQHQMTEKQAYSHNVITRVISHESGIKSIQCIQSPAIYNPSESSTAMEEKRNLYGQIYSHYGIVYHPNLLDDPELIAGKHSTLLAFPSFIVSLTPFAFLCES